MAKAEDATTRNLVRSIASWVERNKPDGGALMVDLEDGRFLTLVVLHDTPPADPEAER